jgi:hypothetical protein
MGLIAYVFHFNSSDIWDMDANELIFWNDRADEISKELRRK